MRENKKTALKKAGNSVKILGINLNSTTIDEVLKEILWRMEKGQKTFIVTPNPEFLVFAQKNHWFKKILNQADFAIPDGIGLLFASRILGCPLKKRVAGADLVEKLLKEANFRNWQIGVVGARRGVTVERRKLVKVLRKKYLRVKIAALEDTPGWQKQKWEIIFACQGMGEQEKWLNKNFAKTKALVFMGAGGSLDFLAGFARRAPLFVRKIGFEWFWRLVHQPWRARRQLALLKFIWLVILQKLRLADFET